jgi:hypothetical protein
MGAEGRCAKKSCRVVRFTLLDPDGAYRCIAHTVDQARRRRYRQATAKGGERSGKTRREQATLNLQIEPTRKSIIDAMVRQANFLATGLRPSQVVRAKLLFDILRWLHEHIGNTMSEQEQKAKIDEILASDLPDVIKLSQVANLVGPLRATQFVKIELKKDGPKDDCLDGQALLREGLLASAPEGPRRAPVEETPKSLAIGRPERQDPGPEAPPSEAAPSPAKAASVPAPAPVHPGVLSETPDERTRRCGREANELAGLFRAKLPGHFRPLQEVGQVFFNALTQGVPFKDLQQEVLFPGSATDQPEAMVSRARNPKRRTVPKGTLLYENLDATRPGLHQL